MVSKLTVGLVSAVMGLVVSAVLMGSLQAGSLEPPGPPAPTMKTLDQIPPTWDQLLSVAERFQTVMGGVAILDKETGLVWEKSPDAVTRSWNDARTYCVRKTLGGRLGWRLPTVSELASLLDPSQTDPALPSGHPFLNIQSGYWSASTDAGDGNSAWDLFLRPGIFIGTNGKTAPFVAWCVRGPSNADTR